MYIETRFYDNGKGFAYPQLGEEKGFDRYIESIGKSTVKTEHDNTSVYESLETWVEEELLIETNDIVDLVASLNSGELVEITNFI